MNTLIFNGATRRHGDTAALIDAFTSALSGRVDVVDCHAPGLSPCLDCRACQRAPGCVIDDDMQAVYPLIERADNIIIASPIWYSALSGPLMSAMSRLQPFFYARRRGEPGLSGRVRRGGVLLCGGGSGDAEPAMALARWLLRAMNCREILPAVASLDTDRLPAALDARALAAARALAGRFNGGA